ncbi:hypothetical protein HOY80DRAFT_177413 [Tuber brumale]|nr:hypothetical protein HOY80DRAFT_177413 [Tuber brumale]
MENWMDMRLSPSNIGKRLWLGREECRERPNGTSRGVLPLLMVLARGPTSLLEYVHGHTESLEGGEGLVVSWVSHFLIAYLLNSRAEFFVGNRWNKLPGVRVPCLVLQVGSHVSQDSAFIWEYTRIERTAPIYAIHTAWLGFHAFFIFHLFIFVV